MIYHEVTTNDSLEIYLNLEELICLASITEQKCSLKINKMSENFDLSNFQIIKEIPKHAIDCEISDFVCMYENDFDDIEGSEFLYYRKNLIGNVFRLDKLESQNLNIKFSKPNYYESKYYVSNPDIYDSAIKKASLFGLNNQFIAEYEYLKNLFARMPLLIFNEKNIIKLLNKNYHFPFTDCFYVGEPDNIFVKKFLKEASINAHDFKQTIVNFNKYLDNVDLNLLCILFADHFTDLYGTPGDYLFGILSKYFYLKDKTWEPNILGNYSYALSENFHFKTVDKSGGFTFSKKNFNVNRSDIMSLIRFPECVL